MTWMRLDDGFDTHPKVLSLVNKADPLNVWVRLLAWAGRQRERDGRVPRVVGLTYGTPKALARLVEVGLYDVTPDGWAIHDFDEYAAKGPSAVDPSDLSRKRAEAGRKGGMARGSRLHDAQSSEATEQATEQATAKQIDFASSNLLQANEAIASARASAPARARAPVPIPSRPDPVPYCSSSAERDPPVLGGPDTIGVTTVVAIDTTVEDEPFLNDDEPETDEMFCRAEMRRIRMLAVNLDEVNRLAARFVAPSGRDPFAPTPKAAPIVHEVVNELRVMLSDPTEKPRSVSTVFKYLKNTVLGRIQQQATRDRREAAHG